MGTMFFDGWYGLLRTFLVGMLAYVALVVILRISGKRTLSKLNAFDFVVTVALGSTLATVLLNKDVALAEGLVAFLLLCLLQFAVTWSSVRSAHVRRWVKSEPAVLLLRGEPFYRAMQQERVTLDELRAAVRSAGFHDLGEADSVVLETDGTLTVIKKSAEHSAGKVPGTDF